MRLSMISDPGYYLNKKMSGTPNCTLPSYRTKDSPSSVFASSSLHYKKRGNEDLQTFVASLLTLLYLNRHRHRASHTEAERGQAAPTAASAQLVDQSGEYAGATGANGMAEGDGAAVDVHTRPVPIQLFAVGQSLGRKGFVDLDQVEVADLQTAE